MEIKATEYFTNLSKIVNEEDGRNYSALSVWTDFRMSWLWENNTPTAWKSPTVDQIHKAYKETFGQDELEKAWRGGKVFRNLAKVAGAFKP